jgi:hypothetical protein
VGDEAELKDFPRLTCEMQGISWRLPIVFEH